MNLDTQIKKQIRSLMQDPRWLALETAFETYKKENFLETSYKRGTEFDTILYVAEREGGKYHLNNFWSGLEREVNNID